MQYILEILPSLFSGVVTTLEIFALTIVLSIPLGILVSLALTGKNIIKAIFEFYVWIMRGTPLLLQLIFIFYGLPIIGIVFPRFEAAVIAFVLNYAAYFAEIFRGGFQSIPKNQFESAKMLRLTRWQTLRKIIIPQVFKIVLPSIGNEVINLVKDSSLVYVIGIGDLLQAGNIATARDVTLVPLILVAVFYLVLTAVLTLILRKIEQRFDYWR
ncbi:Polar amino acid ABC transporter, permease protein [Apilactobacillus kunkeei]|uniref:amino acid ABC transporter permease n=1 Tax=Apilactobacillus kunkeei TaxID=148814 RepID=UPI0006B2514C|nr:amino acid ABC transporter permease [Apilactobacillus kunkeei]KOY78321.1 Polar amino acid ABC transporter, permease protein [Apilactobacillus kunkeei]